MAHIAAVHRRINGTATRTYVGAPVRELEPLNIEELIGLYLDDLMTFAEFLDALPGAGYMHTIIERRK